MSPVEFMLLGYVGSLLGLNLICFLISSFYRKKFQESSPRGGFLAAIVLTLALIAVVAPGSGRWPHVNIARIVFLCGAGISSAVNALSLYYTMKRVRK